MRGSSQPYFSHSSSGAIHAVISLAFFDDAHIERGKSFPIMVSPWNKHRIVMRSFYYVHKLFFRFSAFYFRYLGMHQFLQEFFQVGGGDARDFIRASVIHEEFAIPTTAGRFHDRSAGIHHSAFVSFILIPFVRLQDWLI